MKLAAVCIFCLNPDPNPHPHPHPHPNPNPSPTQVCIFCLSDNFFRDKRSMLLIDRAVRLGKKCELIVMPRARWGPTMFSERGARRDRPFPGEG